MSRESSRGERKMVHRNKLVVVAFVTLAMISGPSWQAAESLGSGAAGAQTEDPEGSSLRRGDAYFHLMKARLLAQHGRAGEVSEEIRQATELDPRSAPLRAEAAGLLASMGRRAEAERVARQALEIDPAEPTALRTVADLLAGQALGPSADPAKRDEAIRLYERIAASPEADDEIFPILANLKLLEGDLPGAVRVARQFASRHPNDPSAAKLLTQLLLQQGQPADALHSLLEFLASNPDTVELLGTVTDLASRTGEWDAVEKAARGLVERKPAQPGFRALWGEALLRVGRLKEAAAELDRALDAMPEPRPGEAAARSLLGEALLRLGQHRDAVEQLERSIALEPGDPLVRLHLASAYGDLGRLADASSMARSLAGDFPANPGIQVVLGESLAQQGDISAAVEAFETAIRSLSSTDDQGAQRRDDLRLRVASLHIGRRKPEDASRVVAGLEKPDDPAALQLRARLHLMRGELEEALVLAGKLETVGERGAAALIAGEARLREGNREGAGKQFEEAIATIGSSMRDQVATVYREAGHAREAEVILRDWVRLEPDNPDANFGLGRFLERSGRYEEAEKALREVLRLDPKNSQALNYLGYSLADRNLKLGEALDLIRRALDLDQWNGAFLDSLGWVYFRMGQYQEAREPLERAAREFPSDPTVLEHLGDLYERLGDRERALAAWRRALEAEPENPEALRSKIRGGAGPVGGQEGASTNPPPALGRRAAAEPASPPLEPR